MKRFQALMMAGALLGALSLAGCQGNVVWVAQDTTALTPRPDNHDVAVQYGTVSRAHRVLGEVRVTRKIEATFDQHGAFDLAVDQMKRQARRVGGDAILNLKAIDATHGGTEGRLTLVGTVVVFTSPATASVGDR